MAKKKVFSIGNALAEGLEETISAAHHYSGELRIEIIPIKRIEVDPNNPRDFAISFDDISKGILPSDKDCIRKRDEVESLQSLANSIKEQGLLNPIIVYKHGETYRLVAGERRTLASILAGKTDIQAKILDSKPDELKVSLLQWIENIERSDLSLWERLCNLEKIAAAFARKKNGLPHQVTVTELSHLLGCSKPHAMNYRAVMNADADLKQLIAENKIKNLEKAALIADIDQQAIREQLLTACLAGASLKKLKVMVGQIRLAPKHASVKQPRGRQATSIHLGTTKNPQVARLILDSILKNQVLAHMNNYFKQVNWADNRSVSATFKQVVKKLEELHF